MGTAITGLSAQREQQIQERQMLRLSRRHESQMRKEIRSTMQELAQAVGNTGKQAEIVMAHRERIKRILTTEWRSAFDWFGNRVLNAAKKAHRLGLEVKLDTMPTTAEFDSIAMLWIQRYGATKVTQIAGTTEAQAMKIINQVLTQAIADGLGEREAAALLRKTMSEQSAVLPQFRSRMIARTETHAAANAANEAAMRATGLKLKGEWVAAQDERTRPDHAAADGQIVNEGQAFNVGGELLLYPGDPTGSAGNVINCRCVKVAVID